VSSREKDSHGLGPPKAGYDPLPEPGRVIYWRSWDESDEGEE